MSGEWVIALLGMAIAIRDQQRRKAVEARIRWGLVGCQMGDTLSGVRVTELPTREQAEAIHRELGDAPGGDR